MSEPRSRVNRRAFLRGRGGVAVGLPFFESLRILNALISAAIQDTGETMANFGSGTPGRLEVVLS